LLIYRLLDGGLATCLEKTDEQGAVLAQQWMGYRGDGEPQRMNGPPRDRVGPIRVVDVPDEDSPQMYDNGT
jgi:hypothetical protein